MSSPPPVLESSLLMACLDEASMGIIVLNPELKIAFWNRWMEKSSTLTAKAVSGHTLTELFPELAGSRLMTAVNDAATRGLPAILSPKLNLSPLPLYPPSPRPWADQPRMSQLITISALTVNGYSRHVFLQIQDVTTTVSRERQLRQQTHDLEQRAEELRLTQQVAQRASMAKSDFLANMSHEIRTPMNAVLGLTNLALQSDPDRKIQDYLEKIHTSGRYLLGLINDILDFSKIEAGKLELEAIHFNLPHLLGRVVDMFSSQAAKKRLELCLFSHPALPDEVVGDPLRLEQILTNLINNAIKFTNQGEVVISARLADLQPENGDKLSLLFSVQDTGIGMRPEQIPQLFQPFTQADSSTTRHFGGTGLGLTISKRLVELMEGEIQAESHPNKGSLFKFTALLHKSNLSRKVIPVPKDSSLNELRILVVDDNLTSCQIVKETLLSYKFSPTIVHSGEEALALFQRGESFPVVIMDWRMPAMDGLTASRKLIEKYRNQTGDPRIILLSAYYQERLCKDARQVGVNLCLTKPTHSSTLFNAILDVLGKRRLPSHQSSQAQPLPHHFLADKHILVVEDNLINQQVAQEVLEKAGATISIANNGRQALQQLHSLQVDAVLMDVQMPEMDGYAATRAIRNNLGLVDLPIIAMTANAIQGDQEKCLTAGMNDYISKPVDVNQLFAILARWLHCIPPPPAPAKGTATLANNYSSLPGFNLAEGLARVGNDQKFYLRLLRQFIKNHGEDGQTIRRLHEGKEWSTLGKVIHTLKGLAGNLAATDLHQCAKALEEAVTSRQESEVSILLNMLESTMAITLESCHQLINLENHPQPTGPVSHLNEDEVDTLLAELKNYLSVFNLRANDVFQQLSEATSQHANHPAWQEMRSNLDKLDYSRAAALLPQIAQTLNRNLP